MFHRIQYKWLDFLRKLQRFSETHASSLYEYSFQHSSAKKVPCTTYRLKMRADSLSLTEEVSQFSTSTSREDFPQQLVALFAGQKKALTMASINEIFIALEPYSKIQGEFDDGYETLSFSEIGRAHV